MVSENIDDIIRKQFNKTLDSTDFTSLGEYPFEAGYVVIDHMIDDPTKWELDKFLYLGEAKTYKVFLITQISNMNSKFICHNCKVIWIYCYCPDIDSIEKPNYDLLYRKFCIKCHEKRNEEVSLEETKLKGIAGTLLLMKKVEIGNKKIGNEE